MKIMITDSKGDSISITIGDNGSFQALKKPLEKGHEMQMDFSSLEKGKFAELEQKTPTRSPDNVNDITEATDTSNLHLLEEQVKSCLNQIQIEPGSESRVKEPDIKVSISSENNKISKPTSLCRLCANRGNDMVYMFESSGEYKNIIDKIEDCLPIVVTKTDTLPKEACRSCVENLELCYKFHKTVSEAEKKFLVMGGKISYDSEKLTKYCQTISENGRKRRSSITGDENGVNVDESSGVQAALSTCSSAPHTPTCVEDSEDESSLAERLADSKNKKLVNKERKRARRDDNPSGKVAKAKISSGLQSVDSKLIRCQICEAGFETVQKCYTHSRIHFTDNYYPCSLCDEIFTVEKDWGEHRVEHKDDKGFDNGGRSHVCNECGKSFVAEDRLEFHMNYHNPRAKPCYCQMCDIILDSESALYQHMKIGHRQSKEFRCEICGKQFRAQASVNAHQRKHRYIRSFECTICNKRFYSKDTLEMHKDTHSNEKNFSCLHCGKSFAQKLPLTLHIQSHTENQSQGCDSSSKTSTIKTERNDHRRSDPGDRPFKCLVCERTFDHSARLREHSSVHTGKRPYGCPLCDKSFKRANARKVHMVIHTGAKPYRCDVCGTNFRRAGDMRRHKKTQHGQNE